ncbi:glutamine synthetase, putative [Medicago truncatula]|uniref:Glutamine synthetase, putative n=1 Tax=Medicago truncatula TaxID=3880 RepID=A0A072TIS1_MEDTR|nr:glutamine synthetase, putative [Medicago truncatula]
MMSTTKRHHLVTTTWMMAKELTVMSYPFDSLQLDSIFTSNPTQLDSSPIITSWRDGLIASCDGLLCFVIDHRLAVLYNPCIRKVVSIFCYGRKYNVACKTQVKVHTLGTNSWRRIEDFPSKFRCDRHGVFESYEEILHPDSGNINISTLDILRDCLCIFSQKRNDSFTDVWLMKEYENKDSWIKLIRLPSFADYRYTLNTKIIYISNDDNHMLSMIREDRRLNWVVYDSKNDTVKSLKIQDLNWVESKVYVVSLISP